MTRRCSLPTIALAVLCATGVARADLPFPDAEKSTVDPCVRVCPAGDMSFHVVVRDKLSVPIDFMTVAVNFSQCPDLALFPLLGSEPYWFPAWPGVVINTDPAGVADFPIRAGGVCHGGPIIVTAAGVAIAERRAVASPDQNGDGVVDGADQAILAAKLAGPYDSTADLNCSGTLGVDDTGILDAHLGHTSQAVVPTRSSTWGMVKQIYR